MGPRPEWMKAALKTYFFQDDLDDEDEPFLAFPGTINAEE